MDPRAGSGSAPVLAAMWRLRWLVLAVTLAGAAGGYGLTAIQTPVYEARARLTLADPASSSVFRAPVTGNAGRRAGNAVQALRSPAVAQEAAALLGGDPGPGAVRGRIAAAAVEDTDLVDIVATGPTAEEAVRVADAVVAAYQTVAARDLAARGDRTVAQIDAAAGELRDRLADLDARIAAAREAATAAAVARELPGGDVVAETRARLAADDEVELATRERNDLRGELETLDARARQVRIDIELYGSGVAAVQPASAPGAPVRPQPASAALMGGAIGLFASAALAAAAGAVRRGVQDPTAPASVLGAPLLGAVPVFTARDAHSLPDPAAGPADRVAARAYTVAAATLATGLSRRGGKVLLVTSPGRGDGTSLSAFNLAAAVSGQGKRVVLLDPESLDEMAPGSGRSATMRIVPLDDPAPHVAVSSTLDRLRDEADLVVVDAPGLLLSARAAQVAAIADGLLVVVANGTALDVLDRTRERVDLLGVPVLGYLFNRAALARPRRGAAADPAEPVPPPVPPHRTRVPASGR